MTPRSSTGGAVLPRHSTWRAEHPTELNELERQFLEASRDAEQDELQVARKRTRRLRVLAIMLAVLLVAAVVSALLAVRQTQRTNEQRELAQARQLASQAVSNLDSRLDLALLLALEAYRTRPIAEARSALVTATQRSGRIPAVLSGHRSELTDVAFSADGRTLATVDGGGTVRLWDGDTGRPRTDALEGSAVSFSPEGDTLVIGHDDGTLTFRDVASGAVVAEAVNAGVGPIGSIDASPSGETLAIAGTDARDSPGGTFSFLDTESRQPVGETLPAPPFVVGMSFTPDGQTLAVGSTFEGVSLWDVGRQERIGAPFGVSAETGEVLTRMAMSPDGTTLVLATLVTGRIGTRDGLGASRALTPVGEPIRPAHAVTSLAFSQDGATLAVGSEDASVTVWDADHAATALRVDGGARGPRNRSWRSTPTATRSPRRARTAALSPGRIDAAAERSAPRAAVAAARSRRSDIAFSPDGSLLRGDEHARESPGPRAPGRASAIRLWDAASGEPVGVAL